MVRQLNGGNPDTIKKVAQQLQQPSPPKWLVWLAGHMSPEDLKIAIGSPEDLNTEVSYALSLLWSFSRSWIAHRWEFGKGTFSHDG